jgi:hypothetical protein
MLGWLIHPTKFGWLIHPTKCIGASEEAQSFTALGTLVDLATQTYAVPPATINSILSGITALLPGPPSAGVTVRAVTVARLKVLVASTWLMTPWLAQPPRSATARWRRYHLTRRWPPPDGRGASSGILVTLSIKCITNIPDEVAVVGVQPPPH